MAKPRFHKHFWNPEAYDDFHGADKATFSRQCRGMWHDDEGHHDPEECEVVACRCPCHHPQRRHIQEEHERRVLADWQARTGQLLPRM